MSATPTPPPTVIGSGKPHTVSIKPGSNAAMSETARPRDQDHSPDLTSRLLATLRRGEEASAAKRGTAPQQVAPAKPLPQETSDAPGSAPTSGLSLAIQQRIAQLRQRNEVVGGEIDRLSAAGRRGR
jgi:hypothetical protein